MSDNKPSKSNRALRLLRTFDRSDKLQFRRFIRSPFHNSKTQLAEVFDALKKLNPDFADSGLDRERLFYTVLPDQSFDSTTVSRWLSELGQLIEAYFVVRRATTRDLIRETLLTEALQERNIYDLFCKQLTKAQTLLDNQSIRDDQYGLHCFLLNNAHFNHPQFRGDHAAGIQILEDLTRDLDNYYLYHKFKIECERMNRERIYRTSGLPDVTTSLLTYAERVPTVLLPTVQLYAKLLHLHRQPDDEERFAEVIEQFKVHINQYRPIEQFCLLNFLTNHCYRLFYRGKLFYKTVIFDLFKFGLEQGCLLPNGLISESMYTNIVVVGLANGAMDWTERFAQTYRSYLPDVQRADVYQYAWAKILHASRRIAEAQDALRDLNYQSWDYKLRARSLHAQIMYEAATDPDDRNVYENLPEFLRQFDKWIRYQVKSEVLSEEKKQAYLNYIRLLRRLYEVQEIKPVDPVAIQALTTEIEQTTPLALKNYIKKQVHRLTSYKK